MVVEDEEDEEALAAIAAAKVAFEASKEDHVLWRGVHSLKGDEFKARGGTEISFMSCSKDRNIAQAAALEQVAVAATMPTTTGRLSTGRRNSREDMRRISLTGVNPHAAAQQQAASAPSASGGPPEVPILLLKLRLPATGKEDDMPSEISMFSVFASEQEWVFPPGTFLEQKKEHTEVIVGCGIEGDQCRVVEIAPYIAPCDGKLPRSRRRRRWSSLTGVALAEQRLEEGGKHGGGVEGMEEEEEEEEAWKRRHG